MFASLLIAFAVIILMSVVMPNLGNILEALKGNER